MQGLGMEPCLLDTQYRMHPDIAALPSAQFYNGRVTTGIQPDSRPGLHILEHARPGTGLRDIVSTQALQELC